jgi:hypothetical protein
MIGYRRGPFVDEIVRDAYRAIDDLRGALRQIMDELGVPDDDYPAPVANAYRIAEAALVKEAVR